MRRTADVFAGKKFEVIKTSIIPKFVIDTIISNWTSCRTIQGVVVLVISNIGLVQLLPELYSTRSD